MKEREEEETKKETRTEKEGGRVSGKKKRQGERGSESSVNCPSLHTSTLDKSIINSLQNAYVFSFVS